MAKQLFFGLWVGAIAVAAVVQGTGAFFSDDETSTGNVFTAGGIDIQIANESYYNGELIEELSWELSDITNQLFINFSNILPGDEGENTINLHVNGNPMWACLDLTLVNSDGTLIEPENDDDTTVGMGDFNSPLEVIWWHDDGDTVLEDDEVSSVRTGIFDDGATTSIALADTSAIPLFGGTALQSNSDNYLGQAWCLGELVLDPLDQDGGDQGRRPSDLAGPGIVCDGEAVDNASQTDILSVAATFRGVQSRNNEAFLCGDASDDMGTPPPPPPPPVLGDETGPVATIALAQQFASTSIAISSETFNYKINGISVTAQGTSSAIQVPVGEVVITSDTLLDYEVLHVGSENSECPQTLEENGSMFVGTTTPLAEGETYVCTVVWTRPGF